MIIRLSDISISYEANQLSFWLTSHPILYERECVVFDLQSRKEAGRISGNITSSPIQWQATKRGAFVQTRGTADPGVWVLTVVAPNDYSLRTDFPIPGGSGDLTWLSNSEIAIVVIHIRKEGCATESPVTDLYALNINDGQLRPITQRGGIAGPLCMVNDDLWCVRTSDQERCVYSATLHRDVWCVPSSRFLDRVVDIDAKGNVLVLMTHASAMAVLCDLLRYPSSLRSIAPLLISGWARPTRASVVDGTTGRRLWHSRPWHILSSAFGSDGRVALSIRLHTSQSAVMEYNPPNWEQRVITTSRKPLLVVGDSRQGWVVLEGDRSLLLATPDRTEKLYEVDE